MFSLYVVLGLVVSYAVYCVYQDKRARGSIPVVPDTYNNLWIFPGTRTLFKTFSSSTLIADGFEKFNSRGLPWQYPTFNGWRVMLPPSLLPELRKPNVKELSFAEETRSFLCMDEQLAPNISRNRYMTPIIRTTLTKSLPQVIPNLIDEAKLCLSQDPFPQTPSKEWTSIKPLFPKVMHIMARISSRGLLGPEFAHNEEFITASQEATGALVTGAILLSLVPAAFRTFVARWVPMNKLVPRAQNAIGKEVDKRIELARQRKAAGGVGGAADLENNDPDMPYDFLQMLITEAFNQSPELLPVETSNTCLIKRIFHIQFAASHTTSGTLTQTLFDLAAHADECIPTIRAEIIAQLRETNGIYTKDVLQNLHYLDSFMKESMRLRPIVGSSMNRMVIKKGGYTFADGSYYPEGTHLSIPGRIIQRDPNVYVNANEFMPWRFLKTTDGTHEDQEKVDNDETLGDKKILPGNIGMTFSSTSDSFLAFGHGKHACPGRFFVGYTIKSLLAQLIIEFDIRQMEHPEDTWMQGNVNPSMVDGLEVRRREKVEQF